MPVQTARDPGRTGFGIVDPQHPSEMRIDLHLHSYASGAATNWWVKGLGLGLETRESYTPPEDAYRLAKAAGMDFVTLTDHETVEGALTLTHHPDVLVGVEVASVFPEDGGAVDILVFGVDTAAHLEIQARRPNVYRLVDFLREAGLVHVLAHPLFEVGAPLDRAAIEKRLVLFGLWEFINGSRPAEQNRLTRRVASGVGSIDLRQMASRQGLSIPPHQTIAGTGGSDDHGGVYPGSTWTTVPRVQSTSELLAALAAGEVRPGGTNGSVDRMTTTGFRIVTGAVSAGDGRADASMPSGDGEPASPLARLLPGRSAEITRLLEHLPLVAALDTPQIRSLVVARYESQLRQAFGASTGFSMLNLISSIGSVVNAHLFIAPYVGVHGYFGRERQKTRALRQQLFPTDASPIHVGLVVDDLDDIHGVATMYQNLQQLAAGPRKDRLHLVRCGATVADGEVALPAIASIPMPLYEGRQLAVPSLLDVLDHVAAANYDVLHIATPGPLGLAAMVAGITLGVPIVGAYHTEFGIYAEVLSGDTLVAEIVDVLVREFYEHCTVVAVPSHSTASALAARGYQIERFEVLKNGVDTRLYRPDCRDGALRSSLGDGRTLLLYVGRVSREKGLEGLADGYLAMRRQRDDVQLVIVGDGPYRTELEARLGDAATFTGFVTGDLLARIFASSDIFTFPSTTDTLGRAVLEAQASGLPAVVFGGGGPQECISPGSSGFVVDPGDNAAFMARIATLLDNARLRERMGVEARAFAETLGWDAVLDGLIRIYRDISPLPDGSLMSVGSASFEAPITAG